MEIFAVVIGFLVFITAGIVIVAYRDDHEKNQRLNEFMEEIDKLPQGDPLNMKYEVTLRSSSRDSSSEKLPITFCDEITPSYEDVRLAAEYYLKALADKEVRQQHFESQNQLVLFTHDNIATFYRRPNIV